MASSGGGKKNKKNKWKTVALEEILPNTTVRATTSWADEVENELTADTLQKITSISLPTAPRAACDVVIDESQIPPDGPFIAYLSNLPYEITEDDIAQQFKELKVSEIQLPKDSRSDRMRGFGYVQFSDKSTLIAALHQREMTIKGRTVRISLASEDEKDKDKGSSRSMGGGSMSFTRNRDQDRFDGPDKTAGDWRAAAVPAHENDKSTSYRSRRGDYGNYRFERNSDREKQEGGIFSRAFSGRDGDRSNNRPFQRFDREEKSGGAFEDRRSGGFFGRSRQGTFGGRDDFVRRSREELDKVEPPKVRPKLQVAPRTIKSDTADEPVVPSAIFGGAKPVDTAAREREIEEKLSKPSSISPRRGNSVTRNTLPQQMSRSSSTSSVRSVGYRNNVIGSYNDISNLDGIQSESAEAKYNNYEEECETREFTLHSDNKTDEVSFVSEEDTAAESTNYPVRGSSSSQQQEKPFLSQSQTDDAHSALSDKPPYTAHSESYKPPHSAQRESNKSPQLSTSETYKPPQSSQRETYKPPVSSQSESYKPAPSQQREPYKPPSSTQPESHKSFQSQPSCIEPNKSSTINESKRSSSVVQEFKPPPRQEFKSPPPPPENFWTRRAQQNAAAAAAVTASSDSVTKTENMLTETKEENTSSSDLTTTDAVMVDNTTIDDKQQDALNQTDVLKNGEENFEDTVEIKGDSSNLPVFQGEYEDNEKVTEEFNRRQQSEKSYNRTAGNEFSTYGRGGIYRGTRGGGRGGENRQGYRDGDRNNYRSNRDDRDYRSKRYDNRNYNQNGETKYGNQSDVTDGNAGNSSNNTNDDDSSNNNNNNNNNSSSINTDNTNSSNNEDDFKSDGNRNRGNNRRNDRQRNFNRPDGAASFRNRNPSTSDGNNKQSGSGGASFKKYDRGEFYYRDRNESSNRTYGPADEYKKMKERWHQRELPKEAASQANSNNSAAVEDVGEKNKNQQSDNNNNEEVSRKFEGNNETKILPSSSNDGQNILNASSVTQSATDDSGTMEFVCTKTAKRRNNKKKRSNLAGIEQNNGNENSKPNDESSKDDNSKGTLTKKLSNEKDKNAKKRDSKQDSVAASKIKEEKRGNLYSLLPSNTELE